MKAVKITAIVLISIISILILVSIIDSICNRKPNIIKVKLNNWDAMTIPPIGIFIDKSQENNLNLIRHEMIHWEQYKKYGFPFFHLKYLYEMVFYGYDKSEMEMQARYLESDIVKNNYTDSVRNGTAITVYNPRFRC